jgi:flagellar motor protein MotB
MRLETQVHLNQRALLICASLVLPSLLGCNRSTPYLTTQPAAASPGLTTGNNTLFQGWLGGSPASPADSPLLQQQQLARDSELGRRAQILDDTNRQLQTQLAQTQQQLQLAADERNLLKQQLQDAANQLQQTRIASSQTQNQLQGLTEQYRGLQNSTSLRGGARLTANSSLRNQTESLSQLGYPVFHEADVVRMRLPADQLFQPNTANLTPSAAEILDRVAEVLRKDFARQRIGIEGHTDTGPFYGGKFSSAQQLAAAQSTAVVEQLQRRNQLPSSQLFSVAHGTNHPLADNQSPAGRSQNRRIEIVVYPDTF